jgi:hypothetical protein
LEEVNPKIGVALSLCVGEPYKTILEIEVGEFVSSQAFTTPHRTALRVRSTSV